MISILKEIIVSSENLSLNDKTCTVNSMTFVFDMTSFLEQYIVEI